MLALSSDLRCGEDDEMRDEDDGQRPITGTCTGHGTGTGMETGETAG